MKKVISLIGFKKRSRKTTSASDPVILPGIQASPSHTGLAQTFSAPSPRKQRSSTNDPLSKSADAADSTWDTEAVTSTATSGDDGLPIDQAASSLPSHHVPFSHSGSDVEGEKKRKNKTDAYRFAMSEYSRTLPSKSAQQPSSGPPGDDKGGGASAPAAAGGESSAATTALEETDRSTHYDPPRFEVVANAGPDLPRSATAGSTVTDVSRAESAAAASEMGTKSSTGEVLDQDGTTPLPLHQQSQSTVSNGALDKAAPAEPLRATASSATTSSNKNNNTVTILTNDSHTTPRNSTSLHPDGLIPDEQHSRLTVSSSASFDDGVLGSMSSNDHPHDGLHDVAGLSSVSAGGMRNRFSPTLSFPPTVMLRPSNSSTDSMRGSGGGVVGAGTDFSFQQYDPHLDGKPRGSSPGGLHCASPSSATIAAGAAGGGPYAFPLDHGRYGIWTANEPNMPDATYEETYGDAYVGGAIRYIYPSGYQSLRPRSGPWKLSLLVFAVFLWLSVFVVGYCADISPYSTNHENRNDDDDAAAAAGGNNKNNQKQNYNAYYYDELDDDAVVIQTRWCGSRLLYSMWVVSISITGLAASYCSIIGYIHVRDFVVANCRSQPPGMVGRSDYYVRIDDHGQMVGKLAANWDHQDGQRLRNSTGGSSQGGSLSSSASHASTYQTGGSSGRSIPPNTNEKTIYQADGTPQFWGGHIYRPTQAAVAVTSR